MNPVHSVTYVDGEGNHFALVTKKHSEDMLDLLVSDRNGNWGVETSVPRRDPSDYGSEGGGRTWH